MPLIREPHAHPTLVNSNMTQYCRAPIQYSKAYSQQVKETFRDPWSHEDFVSLTLEPGD